jgi:hypothetical protein
MTAQVLVDVAQDKEGKKTKSSTGTLEDFIDSLELNEVDEDEKGNAIGVRGMMWDVFSSRQLRMICVRFGIKGYKNKKKAETIEIIERWCKAKKVYQSMQGSYAPRKEVQCAFRLMNILFSDEFASAFATIGNVANREVLDSGKAGNEMHFWEKVQDAFVGSTDNENYNQELQFVDDAEIFDSMHHINPRNIVLHDWKKLRSIWRNVNTNYKSALSRYTVSGTHTSDFFSFCNGDLEVYYLRLHLQQRPELNGMVEADLPSGCFVASEKLSDRTSSDSDKNPTATTGTSDTGNDYSHRKKRVKNENVSDNHNADNQIASAIRDLAHSQMRAEVAKQKLHYMESENSRRQKKNLVEEWEKVQANIRLLRQDLLLDGGILDSESREDIKQDIAGLKKRKIELSKELGFRL